MKSKAPDFLLFQANYNKENKMSNLMLGELNTKLIKFKQTMTRKIMRTIDYVNIMNLPEQLHCLQDNDILWINGHQGQ